MEGRLPRFNQIHSADTVYASLSVEGCDLDSDTTTLACHQGMSIVVSCYGRADLFLQSRKDDFVRALAAFIKEAKFKRVLLLAGTDAGLQQGLEA